MALLVTEDVHHKALAAGHSPSASSVGNGRPFLFSIGRTRCQSVVLMLRTVRLFGSLLAETYVTFAARSCSYCGSYHDEEWVFAALKTHSFRKLFYYRSSIRYQVFGMVSFSVQRQLIFPLDTVTRKGMYA